MLEAQGGIPLAVRIDFDEETSYLSVWGFYREGDLAGHSMTVRVGKSEGIEIDFPAHVGYGLFDLVNRARVTEVATALIDVPLFFPPSVRPVRAGDSWERSAGASGETTVRSTLLAVREAAGRRLAEIETVTSFEAARQDSNLHSSSSRETILVDVDAGARIAMDGTSIQKMFTNITVSHEQRYRSKLLAPGSSAPSPASEPAPSPASPSASVSGGESILLVPGCRVGQRVAFDERVTTRVQVLGAPTVSSFTYAGTYEVIEAEAGIPIALQVVFDFGTRGRSGTADVVPAFNGETLVFRVSGSGQIAVECPTALAPHERALLEDRAKWLLDPPIYLPPAPRPVAAGDEWENKDPRGSWARSKLVAIREEDGRKLAEIRTQLEISGVPGATAATTTRLEGTILCDVETGTRIGADLTGTVDAPVRVELEVRLEARLLSGDRDR